MLTRHIKKTFHRAYDLVSTASSFLEMKVPYFKQGVVALIITCVFLLINGFLFPANNNVFHIPIVLDYFDSAEGPHDRYTQSLDRFVSLFWIIIKPFINESNIYSVFLGIYVVSIFVTALIYLILISEILETEKTWIGLIAGGSILLTMTKESVLGHNEILTVYLTHSQVAVPFVLLTSLFLLRSQYMCAAVSLGVAFNINAFVAIWWGLIAGLVFLLAHFPSKKGPSLKTEIAMIGVFILLASPTIFWIVKTIGNSPHYESFNYIEYLRQFYSLHNLIDTQKKAVLQDILLILLMWSLILFSGKNQAKQKQKTIRAIGLGLTLILVLGAFLPYLTTSRLLNNLYPLRMDSFAYWLIAILAGAYFLDIGRSTVESKVEKVGTWAALLNLNILLTAFLLLDIEREKRNPLKPITFLLVGIACTMTLVKVTWSVFTPFFSAGLPLNLLIRSASIIFLQCFTLGFIASEKNQLQRFFALSPLAWGFLFYTIDSSISSWFVLASLLAAVLSFFNRRAYPLAYLCAGLLPLIALTSSHALLLIFLLAFSYFLYITGYFLHRYSEAWQAYQFKISHLPVLTLLILLTSGGVKAIARGGINGLDKQAIAFNEAQHWARSNTPPDTMFLPINCPGFSVLSRRPVWVDAKWGAVVMWAPELYSMWLTRTQKVEDIKSFPDAVELARNNGISYIVTPSNSFGDSLPYQTKIVYRNQYYFIYKILNPRG